MEKIWLQRWIKEQDPIKNREKLGIATSVVGMMSNVVLFGVKTIVGILSGSISLVADGVNNLSDVGTNVVTLVGFRLAGKPADSEHPFGHGRTEYLSSFGVSFVILLLGYELLKSSVDRILHPVPMEMTWVGGGIVLFTIFVKIWMSLFYKKMARHVDSQALSAASVDSRNDVLATSVVLISFVVSKTTGTQIDGYAGAFVALFILYNGVQFVREAMNTLIGIQPEDGLTEKIYEYIQRFDGVMNLHDVIVHDYGPTTKMVSAHVEISAEYSLVVAHEIVDRIERNILEDLGISLVIHIDPVERETQTSTEIKEGIEKYLKGYGQEVDIRDFRILEEENVVIFDVFFPETFAGNLDHMRTSMNLYLRSKYPYQFLLNLRKERHYM